MNAKLFEDAAGNGQKHVVAKIEPLKDGSIETVPLARFLDEVHEMGWHLVTAWPLDHQLVLIFKYEAP